MNKKVYNDFLLRTKDKKLLRFSYKDNIGIYFETIINNKIINKNIIDKEHLKYFYIFEDYNIDINLIYQDLAGNINLCIISGDSCKYMNLFYNQHNIITPINIKGFSLKNDFMLLYNFDDDANKIYFRKNINTQSKLIYNEKNDININYKIFSGNDYIALIIYSISFNMFKIILKIYDIKSGNWINNKIIFITNHPYTDMSFCITNNKLHSFIIINEEKKKYLIYKYNDLDKKEYLQREVTIYEDEDISSCLTIEVNKVMWLLWIIKDKMYGCYSVDFGESFSKPSIYLDNIKDNIRKVEFIDAGKNKEIYISEENGNITLFLEELIKYNHPFDINYKEITYNFKDKEESNTFHKEIKSISEIANNKKSQIVNNEYNLKK